MTTVERDCVIAGGGPAGVMLGFLLARAGLRVTVLEKHADFLRDFRGDTIHPSTLTVLGELGIRDRFLQLPVTRLPTLDAVFDGERITMVDFRTLPRPNDFLVLAPQWDLLNFLVEEGRAYPGFEVRMQTEATGVVIDDGRIRGVRAAGPDGDVEYLAPLSVAADGRHSVVREAADLTPRGFGVPIDILWFHLPKPPRRPSPDARVLVGEGDGPDDRPRGVLPGGNGHPQRRVR
ncbi:FAD-dependent monooxygenase [Microbacterium sp. HD4P20]|uniref:FAD-dependent monooxygenase n=1 Tax=Microbacterium sp. HD4P20 TaxID=2864874 RepID=UPI0020A4022C|nr:FAD-dependent monooxygenase [Microbacterium sp. HD4P20]MCP2636894.1 FAD-dependent monooxygenase [Microbacterium sp. HD4P20]